MRDNGEIALWFSSGNIHQEATAQNYQHYHGLAVLLYIVTRKL